MKCLMKYQWVKLPRNHLPEGKGIMNAWAKLASRAAFRKGQASYCGHINAVSPGMWSGGVVGLKSILGSRSRVKSLEALSKLSELGYISYSLNAKTKKLTYQITDWVIKCSGEECMDGTVYATEGYGFLCLYDDIKQKADKVVYTSQEYTRGCMHKRNRHLVDNSSACISYLTENKGGTFYTVNYAKSKGVEVINIAE